MPDSQIESFLYREARLMDEHRYEEWLALWAEDEALYWIPCNDHDLDPARRVSIVYDDRIRLAQRVERLMSGTVLAQEPRPPMRRVISNIEIESAEGDRLTVGSNFILGVARSGTQQFWMGRSVHGLRREGDTFRISSKKVLLINADQEMPLLQFLI